MKTNIKITALVVAAFVLFIPAIAAAQGRGNANKPDRAERQAIIEQKVAERREKAETRIAEKRAAAEEKTAEQRQRACEKRVEKINDITSRTSRQATKLLGVMDSFYVKVQGFYDSNQLTVENYDELTASVDAAKEAATVEVAALEETTIEIDCSDPDAVVDVAAFKAGTKETRESLKEYRRTLVDLISSMRSAAAEDKQDSEVSDDSQEEAENENTQETEQQETETETETETEQENE